MPRPFTRTEFILILLVATILTLVGTRPYASGWNDGGRLAAVESLVDRGTFAIDDSIFVNVPPHSSPYRADDPGLTVTGTLDKLRIDGQFYSDKSPVPAILLAGVYGIAQRVTGLCASESPTEFCRLMNFTGGGLPFIVAILAVHLTTCSVGLSRRQRLLLTLSFTLATIAPAYSRTVNNHIMLLAVAAVIGCMMVRMSENSAPFWRWLTLGSLAGLGYTIDLGIGPFLFAAVAGWAMLRVRVGGRSIAFAAGAAPWLILHHAVNFAIAGTIGPANAHPEYLDWPGSPFGDANMTGRWHHDVVSFAIYAVDLLVGQHGILGHNLPMYLGLFGAAWLLWHGEQRPLVLSALGWCGSGFLVYTVTSNNYSGICLSIRWFVPMLAPSFLFLALLLKRRPDLWPDLLLLSSWNLPWAIAGWFGGPFERPPVTLYWLTMGPGLASWGAYRLVRRLRERPRSFASNRQLHHLPLQFSPVGTNNTLCVSCPPTRGEPPNGAAQESRRAVR